METYHPANALVSVLGLSPVVNRHPRTFQILSGRGNVATSQQDDEVTERPKHRDPCPAHPKDHQWEPINTPTTGQFDLDDDLKVDVYKPLETPTDTPIQDESTTPIQEDIPAESVQSNVVTAAKDCMLEEVDNNVSVVSSSQEK